MNNITGITATKQHNTTADGDATLDFLVKEMNNEESFSHAQSQVDEIDRLKQITDKMYERQALRRRGSKNTSIKGSIISQTKGDRPEDNYYAQAEIKIVQLNKKGDNSDS